MEHAADLTSLPALPFVGRTAELERLVRFWRGTLEGEEMRAALLTGEAGIGKSRLVDELATRVAAGGGVVIHARLVPESATAIVPLLAQGLAYSETARPLLRGDAEETLSSVTGALRRLARLRPTLVILEDLHLSAGNALRDMALLIDALAGESLTLLATSRPVELPARASLERVLVETIRLDGLDESSIAELWERLFEGVPRQDILRSLISSSAGNPLALRSALRGAIRAGEIRRDPATSAWSAPPDAGTLARTLRASVDLLAEGMAAHLTAEELDAATMLATLGEVFPPESAEMLLEERAHLVESLMLKGIVVRASSGLPMLATGHSTADPVTFTHTLLHQHLVAVGVIPAARLVRLIVRDAPLHSVVPFRLLTSSRLPGDIPADDLRRAIDRVVDISYRLDSEPDWRLADDVISAGWHFLEALRGTIPESDELHLRLTLLSRTLASQRRSVAGERYAECLDRMLELTAGELPPELLGFRLRAFYHRHLRLAETTPERCGEVWREVGELCARHPELERTETFLYYLDDVARTALRTPDVAMLRLVERRLESLLALPDLDESIRAMARRCIASSFLLLFDTADELGRRMAFLESLSPEVAGDNAMIVMNRIALLETTGRMEEGLAAARSAMERFDAIGLPRSAAHCALISLCCRVALGAGIDAADREIQRLISGGGYTSSRSFRRNVAIYLTETALLRGELGWARRIQESVEPGTDLYWPEGRIIIAMEEGAMEEGRLAAELDRIELDEEGASLGLLARAVAGGELSDVSADAALTLLERPVLRLEDLLRCHAALSLLAALPGRSIYAQLRSAAGRALSDALDWTLERRLPAFAGALLARYPGLLPGRECEPARRRLKQFDERRRKRERKSDRAKIAVRMIGAVTVTPPDGEPASMRGFRMRRMLALLVGVRMISEPMTHRELCRLAAGGELDPDLARKTANMAVLRLREAIGAEAVLVGEETYELDLDRVEVDVLEASALIDAARRALQRRSLARAVPALLAALDIVRGDVPFPGFYDEFFEALRDDFEYRLRRTVIDTARALLREADVAGAEALLRRALQGLPGDEEIGELLREALDAAGMRADSAMVGMKVMESGDD